MTGRKKKIIPIASESDRPTCKECLFFTKEDEVGGEAIFTCHRYPPTPIYDAEDGLFSAHPYLEGGEIACGEFRGKQ